jgi:FKBP-type peptidyl-prolyl cis-trans isomerase
MKLNLITPLAFAVAATQLHAAGNLELNETKDKASYAIGLSMGSDFHDKSINLNTDALAAGLKDGLAGTKPQLTEKECHEALTAWQKEQMEKMLAHSKELGEKKATNSWPTTKPKKASKPFPAVCSIKSSRPAPARCPNPPAPSK